MAEKKAQNKIYTSPKGVAVYPWLNKPDTKFKAEGEYTVRLKLDSADEAVQEFANMLQKMIDDTAVQAKKGNPKKTYKKNDLFKAEVDDNGDETGNILFNFKMKAKVTSKKDGKTYEMKPTFFNAAGVEYKETPLIGGGSLLKIGFTPDPYVSAKNEVGVSLRLSAVQVIKLKSFGDKSAASYGFQDESEGTPCDEGAGEDVPASVEGDNNGDF